MAAKSLVDIHNIRLSIERIGAAPRRALSKKGASGDAGAVVPQPRSPSAKSAPPSEKGEEEAEPPPPAPPPPRGRYGAISDLPARTWPLWMTPKPAVAENLAQLVARASQSRLSRRKESTVVPACVAALAKTTWIRFVV